jgi:predicted nucleic acid-binding protein
VVQTYIVDASVLIQGFAEDNDSARVQSLIKSLFEPEPPTLIVPEFCLLECANILWKRTSFHGLPPDVMQRTLTNLTTTPLTIQPIIPLLPRALTIGVQHQLAVYDSVYIAISETLQHPLITVDERQEKAAVAVGISLKSLTDFPELKPSS